MKWAKNLIGKGKLGKNGDFQLELTLEMPKSCIVNLIPFCVYLYVLFVTLDLCKEG